MLLNCSKSLLASFVVLSAIAVSSVGALAQQVIKTGGVLSGELQAMRNRGPEGKNVDTFQLVSVPRRLPGPNGLCNLETGPETFEIATNSDTEMNQLKSLIGKQISIKAKEVSCSEQAGQMSDAVVLKWSLVKVN